MNTQWFKTSAVLLGATAFAAPGLAQTFSLDDNPSAPLIGPASFGFGAEDPFGFGGPGIPPGYAPSPILPTIPGITFGDGDFLEPGPVVGIVSPGRFYISAISRNNRDYGRLRIAFSVDRLTKGQAGTAVAAQANRNQAAGDVFRTRAVYAGPGGFVGSLVGPPYVGPLPSLILPAPTNILQTDDSFFGLLTGGAINPPGVIAPPVAFGTHDNVDGLDFRRFDANGDGLFDDWTYFALYPAESLPAGLSPGDIYVIPPGTNGPPRQYASFQQMGLNFEDAVDALIVYEQVGSGNALANPALDYALFSLAPGSMSLMLYGLDAGDVFFTDFTGHFALFARSADMGLMPMPGGMVGATDNTDAAAVCCYADLDNDCKVGLSDIGILLGCWGAPCGDLNGDGTTDLGDFGVLFAEWGCNG